MRTFGPLSNDYAGFGGVLSEEAVARFRQEGHANPVLSIASRLQNR